MHGSFRRAAGRFLSQQQQAHPVPLRLSGIRFYFSDESLQPDLPKPVIRFLQELDSYYTTADDNGNTTKNIHALSKQLKRLFCNLGGSCDFNLYRLVLQESLYLEEQDPEFHGQLVTTDSFLFVLQTLVRGNHVEQADELLLTCINAIPHFRPHHTCFNIVVNGYAKRKNAAGLQRIKELVTLLEDDERLQALSATTQSLSCYTYNILMNAYIEVLGKHSVVHVKQTFDRMETIAKRFHDDSLRPDLACCATLMKAVILRRQPGFALEVNAMLDKLKLDLNYLQQPAKKKLYLECLAMDAWSKSKDPQALKRARQIFDAIEAPNSVAFNSLLKMYGEVGDIDEVYCLYQEMQADSKTNKDDRPTLRTYTAILKALQTFHRPDAAEKAEEIFSVIPLPDTMAYTALITIYAQRGNVENAFELFHRMQSEFDSGTNKHCRPNRYTYSAVLNALQKSQQPDAIEKAEQIVRAIPTPDTVLYNTLLNMYAHNGSVEKALNLLRHMQSEFESGNNQHCRPSTTTYNILLKSLLQSNRSDASETAEQLFSDIPAPDTITFSTVLNGYAQIGNVDQALALLQRMQSDFDSGTNPTCRPNDYSRATVLNALQKSNRPDAVELAEQIVQDTSFPNTVLYTTLLHIYATRRGMGQHAVALTARMQSDFDTGANRQCRPNRWTRTTLEKALLLAKDPVLDQQARGVLDWFEAHTVD